MNLHQSKKGIIPNQSYDSYSSYHIYIVRIREILCRKTQRQMYDALTNAGIGINLHYIPVYMHPFYEEKGFKKGYCPEAELYYKETITLPIHPSLNNEQQDYIIYNVKKILK